MNPIPFEVSPFILATLVTTLLIGLARISRQFDLQTARTISAYTCASYLVALMVCGDPNTHLFANDIAELPAKNSVTEMAATNQDLRTISSDHTDFDGKITQESISEGSLHTLNVNAIMPTRTTGPVHLANGQGYRVVAGPYYAKKEGARELNHEIVRAITNYVDEYVGRQGVGARLDFDADYARQNLLDSEPEEETKNESYPATRYMSVVLRFDDAFRNEVDHRWKLLVQKSRLKQASWIAGVILALLLTIFGYLNLDLATYGRYT